MKKLFTLLFVCVLSILLCACTNTPSDQPSGDSNVLRVGMECAYAPFNWTDTVDNATNYPIANVPGSFADGYDVQIAIQLASSLGMTLEIYALEWDALVQSCKDGVIDLIIAGMSPTDERKLSIDFSEGYYRSTHVMLVSASGSYTNATRLSDFAGAVIAGQAGTIYADLVSQAVAAGAVAGTEKAEVGMLVNDIVNGVIDGQILEEPVAFGLCEADSRLAYVKLTNGGFVVSDEDALVSIGMRKGYEHAAAINSFLASLSESTRADMMNAAVVRNAGN